MSGLRVLARLREQVDQSGEANSRGCAIQSRNWIQTAALLPGAAISPEIADAVNATTPTALSPTSTDASVIDTAPVGAQLPPMTTSPTAAARLAAFRQSSTSRIDAAERTTLP